MVKRLDSLPPGHSSAKDASAKRKEFSKKELLSMLALILMLVNTCIGSAVLAVPYYTANLGWPLSVVYLAVSTGYTIWSYKVIIDACIHTGAQSLVDIVIATGGKPFRIIVDICTLLVYLGITIIYVVVTSSYIQSLYNLITKTQDCSLPPEYNYVACAAYEHCVAASSKISKYIQAIVGCVIFVGLSLLPSVSALNSVSMIVLIVALLTTASVVFRCAQALITDALPNAETPLWVRPEPRIPFQPDLETALSAFPVFFLLYTCQPSLPPLFRELQGTAESKAKIIRMSSYASTILACVIYAIMAYVGSLVFYGENQPMIYRDPNILSCFPTRDIFMSVIRILYGLVVIVSSPVILFPMRSMIMDWFKASRKTKKGLAIFFAIGICIDVVATLAAIVVPNITVVFNIAGSFFGVMPLQVVPVIMSLFIPKLRDQSKRTQASPTQSVAPTPGDLTRKGSTMLRDRSRQPSSSVLHDIDITEPHVEATRVRTKSMSNRRTFHSHSPDAQLLNIKPKKLSHSFSSSSTEFTLGFSRKRLALHMLLLGFFVSINCIAGGFTIYDVISDASKGNVCTIE